MEKLELPVILIIEDEEPIQSIVEDALSEAGFEPAIAPSGEEAVTLLRGRASNTRGDFQRCYGTSISPVDRQVAWPLTLDGEPGNESQWRL